LANVYKVRLIAESKLKTDRVDAKALANLLRTGYLPEGYVAPKELRETRTYLRYRINLARERGRLKNQVKRLLRVENIEGSFKDTFGKKGMEWLRELELRPIHNRIKEERMAIIEYYNKLISKLDRELEINSKTDQDVQLLMTIPGIGKIGAHLIMAEMGDVRRFNDPRKFASYTGLVCSIRSSADRFYRGRITKQGSAYLRWIFVEAAHMARRADYNLDKFFNKIAFKRGKKIAIIALARRLSEICWHILVSQSPYDTNRVQPVRVSSR
jgi:transposase